MDAEDGGHKNDKVNSTNALMGDRGREGGTPNFKEGDFLVVLS